ncbi:hypothetical protein EYZ11_013377 [Aspergillus tanneri]|uniref:Uncharacterized protein n=1 Tax=Aspergillus tanneri TaxID=1220188 RepID=A0A4S3IZX8_9EURO|nr:hypothetical protein EYZ11_013377 [Aspergillus tanneri]
MFGKLEGMDALQKQLERLRTKRSGSSASSDIINPWLRVAAIIGERSSEAPGHVIQWKHQESQYLNQLSLLHSYLGARLN